MNRDTKKCSEEDHVWEVVREQYVLNQGFFRIRVYLTKFCCERRMQRMKTVGTFRCEKCNATKQVIIAEFGQCQQCCAQVVFWGKTPGRKP